MDRPALIESLLPLLSEMDLGMGVKNEDALQVLKTNSLEKLFSPFVIRDRFAAMACLAGLHLLANDIEGAHKIAQDLATPEGSFWHAIVHRRDGDFWNAKFWIRKVGQHPVYTSIAKGWDANAFVDQVEKRVPTDEGELKSMQVKEWYALFEFCLKEACG